MSLPAEIRTARWRPSAEAARQRLAASRRQATLGMPVPLEWTGTVQSMDWSAPLSRRYRPDSRMAVFLISTLLPARRDGGFPGRPASRHRTRRARTVLDATWSARSIPPIAACCRPLTPHPSSHQASDLEQIAFLNPLCTGSHQNPIHSRTHQRARKPGSVPILREGGPLRTLWTCFSGWATSFSISPPWR